MAELDVVEGRINFELPGRTATALSKLTPDTPVTAKADTELPVLSDQAWTIPLNIVVQVVGSRGDVQPFIAMGNELQRFGHRVRIATHNVFQKFVEESNLEFYPIGGDPSQLMSYMVRNPGLIPSMKTLKEGEISAKRAMVRTMLGGCWRSCITPDPTTGRPFVANAIIANPPAFAHIHCAQALSIPLHLVFTMPWTPTVEFMHPLANIQTPTPNLQLANYLSFGLVQSLTWQGLGDVINDWRSTLGLEKVPFSEGPFLAETLTIPTTYCWSPALIPKPRDWPTNIDVCGFMFRDPPKYTPPQDLEAFLAAGPPPVYIGFGSIVIDNPDEVTNVILDAVETCKIRAIVSRGWSKLGGSNENTDRIFYLDDCPHEWLFQHVAAVVHHGGAGTTACGLRFGKPTVIVPFFGDQPFWGNMVATAGAGPTPLSFKMLNSEHLATALRFALQPNVTDAAGKLAEAMQKENGVKAAVASFHRNLSVNQTSCDLELTLPAVWQCISKGKEIKLSGIAAQKMLKDGEIKPKNLQLYRSKPINIENRRFDPFSAATSSMLSVSVNILNSSSEIYRGPKRIKSRQKEQLQSQETLPESEGSSSSVTQTNVSSAKLVPAMVGASAMSIPHIFHSLLRGMVVDVPLSVAEGLRASPRLYGATVTPHAPIEGFSSGARVAGQEMKDIFSWKYDEGDYAQQAFGKVTQTASAFAGLFAYPAQGLWKTVYTATHRKTRNRIVEARMKEMEWDFHAREVGRGNKGETATSDANP